MIHKLSVIQSRQTNPYENLALEEYLLEDVKEDECILFLWQNANTVVIGRNQNCWKECKTALLEADGGYVVRRLSGGGAVYHDLGNLNFTFLTHKNNYNLNKQLQVILAAVREWNIPAKRSGRNDITVNGRKFSGNAFYRSGERTCHHGTILIDANLAELSRYLNVSQEKMRSKGIDSVKARVANLSEFNTAITAANMREKLIASFKNIYALPLETYFEDRIDAARIEELTRKFTSWDWIYGRPIPFTCAFSRRFSWGEIEIQCNVQNGRLQDIAVFSDAMDAEFILRIQEALKGRAFSTDQMEYAVEQIRLGVGTANQMAKDIRLLLRGGVT